MSSISAYQLYNNWLKSALATSNAAGDFERLNNSTMDQDLAKLASDTTQSEQLKDLAPIEKYVATQLPVIPTVYGAAFDEYNTSHFTGWPSASNPYESGRPNALTNEVIVLRLRPVRLPLLVNPPPVPSRWARAEGDLGSRPPRTGCTKEVDQYEPLFGV